MEFRHSLFHVHVHLRIFLIFSFLEIPERLLLFFLVKYDWDPAALRKAALLAWKSLCRFACSHRFKHSKSYCFINAEELLLVSIRSFGLEHLDCEIPSVPDMYLLCPYSIASEDGTIYKPLILFCQRNWPEIWNSQTSSDEDLLRASSDKYNFGKAKEWYKYPIKDEKSDDIWSENFNAAKRRKCVLEKDIHSDVDEEDDVILVDANRTIIEESILANTTSSSNSDCEE